MARVNTANPLVRETPRRKKALGDQSAQSRLGAQEPVMSRCSNNSNARSGDSIQGSSPKQRVGTSTMFDIFPDPAIESGSSASNTPTKQKSRTLKSTKANSLLPMQRRPRHRMSVKVETDDYDKENDITDNVPEPFTTVTDTNLRRQLTRQNLHTDALRTSPASERPPSEVNSESEEEDAISDQSSDSLDDFIVSDNDEISYHASSDSETEEEKAPTPPKSPRKRLLRGRRPPSTTEPETSSREYSGSPSCEEATFVDARELPSSSELAHQDSLQEDEALSSQLDGLKLADNAPVIELGNTSPSPVEELDSPIPATHQESKRPKTPPSSPSKQRLESPTKQKIRIPPTPHRESVDAFWNQEETIDWIDRHSPRKEKSCGRSGIDFLKDVDNSDNEDSSRDDSTSTEPDSLFRLKPTTPNTKSPSKTAVKKAQAAAKREAKARRLSFNNKKAGLAETFLRTLDGAVSGGKITELAQATGGIKIVWSKTLLKTAGRARWKAERIRARDMDNKPTGTFHTHHASIELAERIIDDEYRLINTVTHEYCHLANYMISNVTDNPHGASFKAWGSKCSKAMKDHPVYGGKIEVTTKHNYEIEYKYVWECSGCGQTYGRHSKSIDTDRQRCGSCRNKLVQIKPKPRNVSPRKNPITPTVQKKVGLELAQNLEGITL